MSIHQYRMAAPQLKYDYKALPNDRLMQIIIKYQQIKQISKIEFPEKQNCTKFCHKEDLSRNEISSVRSGDFTAWQMLSLLYLNYNKIHHVAIDAFLPNHIRNLMVTNNQLVCVPHVQGQNETLTHLLLSHNKLGSCTEEVIYKVPMFRLHSLQLDSNDLHKLPSNLKWLNLKNNLLTAITPFNTEICKAMICVGIL